MGNRERQRAKFDFEDDDDCAENKSKRVIILSSSDDEEANEDLSLRIVEKAMSLRASRAGREGVALDQTEGRVDGLDGVVDISSPSIPEAKAEASADPSGSGGEIVDAKNKKRSKKEKWKSKKSRTIETLEETVQIVEEDNEAETVGVVEADRLKEPNAVEISDNVVLRKLLRGPRYFDPPDSGWGTCYNCGEEGHAAVNCLAVKRKKPCFVCGSLEHSAKNCVKGFDCFICKTGGHRAKDCPEKRKVGAMSSKICLKCGDPGHDMFLCRNEYSPGDLKEVQCYICKSFGHLCCGNFADPGPSGVSCYRCGQLGHAGLECGRLHGETSGVVLPSSCYKCGGEGHFARECTSSAKECGRLETSGVVLPSSCYKCGEEGHFARECSSSAKECGRLHGETSCVVLPNSCYKCGTEGHFARECPSSAKECGRLHGEVSDIVSPSSCYKCGEIGHFARECANSAKLGKRNRELSTPARKFPKEKDYLRFRSAPHNLGKVHKKKRIQYNERGVRTPYTSKLRSGWITEDPGGFSGRKARLKSWRSPLTPSERSHKTSTVTAGGHFSSSQTSKKTNKQYFGTPPGSANNIQHRYSAVRFGNFDSGGMMRSHDYWW